MLIRMLMKMLMAPSCNRGITVRRGRVRIPPGSDGLTHLLHIDDDEERDWDSNPRPYGSGANSFIKAPIP